GESVADVQAEPRRQRENQVGTGILIHKICEHLSIENGGARNILNDQLGSLDSLVEDDFCSKLTGCIFEVSRACRRLAAAQNLCELGVTQVEGDQANWAVRHAHESGSVDLADRGSR